MKKTSPAARLPAIDRRSLVRGLGTAAFAGVPAPMSDDHVFQAMAALEQTENSRRRTGCAGLPRMPKPATPAGAVALLRFTAGLMEGLFDDDEHEHYVGALRNAADFFEGGASA